MMAQEVLKPRMLPNEVRVIQQSRIRTELIPDFVVPVQEGLEPLVPSKLLCETGHRNRVGDNRYSNSQKFPSHLLPRLRRSTSAKACLPSRYRSDLCAT